MRRKMNQVRERMVACLQISSRGIVSRRGSIVLASMMAISFAVLVFVGSISTTLGERLRVDHLVRGSKALQLAHTGVEYVLWEMNYGGNNFGSPWSNPNNPNIFEATFNNVGPNQDDTLIIEFDKTTSPNWTVTSNGTRQNVTRKVSVGIQPLTGGAGFTYFDHPMYTKNAKIYLGAGTTVEAYKSGGGAPTIAPVIRTDYAPLRDPLWADETLPPGKQNVAAIVIDEGVNLGGGAKLELRDKKAGEGPIGWEIPGYVLYPEDAGKTEGERLADHGIVEVISTGNEDSLSYPIIEDGIEPGLDGYVLDLFLTDRICPSTSPPGSSISPDQIYVDGGTLVIGCTNAAGPDSCATHCPGDTQDDQMRITTGYEGWLPYEGYGAVVVANGGQIVVHNPTDVYYNDHFAVGLDIGGNGIDNKINGGAPDPTKLTFYRNDCLNCLGGLDYDIIISTTQPFHGAIFDPDGIVTFKNGATPLDFYGALNVGRITTYDGVGNSVVHFHWDQDLIPEDGGSVTCTPEDSVNNPCKPAPGSWSFDVGL